MRAFVLLIAILATFAGSYGAFLAIQAVGPEDRTGEYGYGDAATEPPGGGTLFESRNFARVVAALERELGPDGRLQSLTVRPVDASAMAIVDGKLRYVDIDASGRARAREGDRAEPAGVVPVARLDAKAIDKIVLGAAEAAGVDVETLTLYGGTRQWNVEMLDGGEPDAFVVNLNGNGLRLSGEPNPEPIGAEPDSLLRAANLKRVVAAAREASPDDGRVSSLDIRPDRVSFEVTTGGRTLSLAYGYDAQLTNRDLRASTGAESPTIGFEDIDPQAVERMARTARTAVKSKGLGDVQYVLLNTGSEPDPKSSLSMYLADGSDPPYVVADLHGRHLTWPGRT